MRILSLNTWHGECASELRDFLRSQLETTDVFCFQEAFGSGIEGIMTELFASSHFDSATTDKLIDVRRHYTLYTFAKKPLKIARHESILDESDGETGQALATELDVNGQQLTLINVHGMPYPGHKLDTDGRLRQTEQIIAWLQRSAGTPAVVCGDFNLLPSAKSVQDFAAAGYRDLIAEYAIPTTRNELAWAKHPDNKQLFADYAFTSPGLEVREFTVPDIEVSDHLPMSIDVAI